LDWNKGKDGTGRTGGLAGGLEGFEAFVKQRIEVKDGSLVIVVEDAFRPPVSLCFRNGSG